MIQRLVLKELRESAGVLAIAALGLTYALITLMRINLFPWQAYYGGTSSFPFVNDALIFYLILLGAGLAIALGLKQSAWELGTSTYYFLLHRPLSRTRLFATKLIIGVTLVMLLTATTILIYAWWAASPGGHATPFFWSMTLSAWQTWSALPLVYLGAFLSGIRPGHWFGTRLAPLVAAGVLAIAAAAMPWLWLTLLLVLAGSAVLAVAIFHYVRHRDF